MEEQIIAASKALPPPKNFRLMVAGQIVTVFGASLLRFALSLYVLDVTGRADIFATLLAISSVPLLLTPIGGVISDRFNRRVLMVLYDAACCAITCVLLFVMWSGHISVFTVGVVVVLLGFVGALESPNGVACVPLLVEQEKLGSANGVIQSVQSLSGIIAPAVGGALYGALSIQALVLISGLAFGLAAIVESFIKIPYAKCPQAGSMTRALVVDLKDGFRYVWNESFIRKLMLLATLLNLALVPCFMVASPLILRETLHANDTVYGVGLGIINAAAILGGLTVGVFAKRMTAQTIWRWVLGIGVMFAPLALSVIPVLLGSGFWPPFILFMLCVVIMFAATMILNIVVITRVQSNTPGENLGKVMAIIIAVAQCAAPIGQYLYGAAFEVFRNAVYLPLLVAGGIVVGVAFIGRAMLKNERD